MKRYLYIIFCVLWQITLPVMAQKTLSLLNGGEFREDLSLTVPVRKVTSLPDGVLVSYEFDNAIIQDDPQCPEAFLFKIAGFGQNGVLGEPAIPIRWDSFSIPDGWTDASVSIVESTFTEVSMQLSPSRPPLPEGKDDWSSEESVITILPYRGWFPKEIVKKKHSQVYRGKSLFSVGVSPVQYDYENKVVRAYTKIIYEVTFHGKKSANRSVPGSKISPDDYFLGNTTLNESMQQALSRSVQDTTSAVKDYLIISVPKYEEAVERFADWKRTLGYHVHIRMNDVWTPKTIKKEVSDVYQRNESLYYLLIVGDHEDVPAQKDTLTIAQGMGKPTIIKYVMTDFFYSCMDGPFDYLPDLYRGRLSVSSPSEAQVVINKIINYEKNPVQHASFYTTGLHCAYFQDDDNGDGYADRRFAQTSEEVRDYMLVKNKDINRVYYTPPGVTPKYWNKDKYSFGEPIPEELLKPDFTWDGDSKDIIKQINGGAFYVLYRGHGQDTCWEAPYFTVSNINELSNGEKLPVIFNINCLTGRFDGRTCFAEAFLRNKDGGCVAIYGAAETSYSGYNDALVEGMFDAIWPSPGLGFKIPGYEPYYPLTPTPVPTYSLGQILDQGMKRMEETWGVYDYKYTLYTREIYHCFGDPGMKMFTDTPAKFTDAVINRNSNGIHVDLGAETGNIVFYNELTKVVTSYSGTIHDYNGDESHVRVCISGHNKIPHINLPYETLYIQNDTIRGSVNFKSDAIKVGANVTELKTAGNVVFSGGKITLSGNNVILDRGTIIMPRTEVEIKPIK